MLSQLPTTHPHRNALVGALVDAAQHLGVVCDAGHILLHTGWGWGIVAAEEWWDPATTLWHPTTVPHIVPALADEVARALQRLAPLGLMCRDAWFVRSDQQALAEFIRHGIAMHEVVLLWGCNGPGYTMIHAASASGVVVSLTDDTVLPYSRLHTRGGIHCIRVSCAQDALMRAVKWQNIVMPLKYSSRIAFDTPTHPLRTYQTWHSGIGAWDVLASSATQAAPLALVSTHVAQIVSDYSWRFVCMHAHMEAWQTHVHHPHALLLTEALADCCFFMGILYKHYAHSREIRALTVADGALIAAVCHDIASTLREVCKRMEA